VREQAPILLARELEVLGPGLLWGTPWVEFPARFQNAQLTILCHSFTGTSVVINCMTSWDTDQETTIGTATILGPGFTIQDITTGIGPLVRLIFAPPIGGGQCVVSVWLTPKST
jgi:hypothetical protein